MIILSYHFVFKIIQLNLLKYAFWEVWTLSKYVKQDVTNMLNSEKSNICQIKV